MIYILINFIFYWLSLLKENRYTLPIIFVILTFLSGTRYEVGGDVDGYINIFDNIKTLSDYFQGEFTYAFSVKFYIEWFFSFINSVIKTLGLDYYVVFLVTSLLINIYIVKNIYMINKKLEINYMIFFIVYFNFVYFLTQMWYIRQGLAGVFILYAVISYVNQEKLKSYVYYILALGTHVTSSIVLLPFLVIILKLSNRLVLLLLFGSINIYFFKIPLLDYFIDFSKLFMSQDINFLLIYSEEFSDAKQSLSFSSYLNILISFYILTVRNKIFNENIYYKIITSYVILSTIFSLLFYELQIMGRINITISIGLAFFFATEYYNVKQKGLYVVLVILLSWLYFLRVFLLNEYNYNLFFHYDNFIVNILRGVIW